MSIVLSAISLLRPGVKLLNTSQEYLMTVTEITTVLNATDEIVEFMNTESPRDNRQIPAQSAVSLQTPETPGAWIPWYDPPIFGGFSRRHMKIHVGGALIGYFWQRADYIYWCGSLGSDSLPPSRLSKAPGVAHIGGSRMLVIRYDPEHQYGFFLAETTTTQQAAPAKKPGGLLPPILGL